MFGTVRAVPRLGELNLTTEEKARKNLSQGSFSYAINIWRGLAGGWGKGIVVPVYAMKVREVQLHAFLTALLSVGDTAGEAGWPPGSFRMFRIREHKSLLLVGESNHDSPYLHHVDYLVRLRATGWGGGI
jgi:hypothetical protein